MFKSILHLWRLLVQPSGKDHNFIVSGRWRVRYNKKYVSIPMCYDVACDYAKMFNGKVEKTNRERGE